MDASICGAPMDAMLSDDESDEDDACWGLAPDWASVALLCERAGGTLLSYDDGRDRRRRSLGAPPRSAATPKGSLGGQRSRHSWLR